MPQAQCQHSLHIGTWRIHTGNLVSYSSFNIELPDFVPYSNWSLDFHNRGNIYLFALSNYYYSLKLQIRLLKRILQAESILLCQPENALISISAQLLWNLLLRLSVSGIKENTFCKKREAHMLRIVYVIRQEHQFLFGPIPTAVRTRRTSIPLKFCMIKQLTGDLMIGRQCVR